jgi:hypothetical protein
MQMGGAALFVESILESALNHNSRAGLTSGQNSHARLSISLSYTNKPIVVLVVTGHSGQSFLFSHLR